MSLTKVKPKKVKAVLKTTVKPKAKVKTQAKVNKVKAKTKTMSKVESVTKKALDKAKPTVEIKTKSSVALGPIGVKAYQIKKGEAYMNDEQLAHFRSILLQWKSQLMREVDRTVANMQNEAANYPDPVDRASQEEGFNLELRTRDRERKLLKKIEEMLNRIGEHDYGFCDDCGAEIGIRRLEARPTANQCIECKTIAELREKQVGDGSSN